ncbi:MAG: nitrile hydratase subunit beta [Alphaproteobacteria bacterium]|nr:nitrile hydratase subunit beta [Alphaproteobacteria bacterium]
MTRFSPGDRVRVPHAFPPGHVRTPQFVRGRTGTVIRHFGAFPNPSLLAYGLSGLPRLDLYQVAFEMDEVWSGDGAYAPGDTVTADIYDNWLEPVED